MGDDDITSRFDELFEPFELDDGPPEDDASLPEPPPPVPTQLVGGGAGITCPSCGAANPPLNRHCERCGARLVADPLPVAPRPSAMTSPGARALGVLAGVVLVVALVALVVNVFGGGDDGSAVAAEATSTTVTTQPPVVTEVFPVAVTVSSELGDRWSKETLIDGDPDTYWNDASLRGREAWIEFRFGRPVQLTEIEVLNIPDETKFKQNYRVQGYTIEVDDLDLPISGRLRDTNEPQRIDIASLNTTVLTFRVNSTFEAQSVGDNPPFKELAIAEFRFFGVEK